MNRSSMPKQVMTFSNGGLASFIPKQTMINRQPHSLAYINPQEAALLRGLGGSGNPGPGGIPAYDWSWAESSLNPKNWGGGGNNNSSAAASTDNNDSGSNSISQTVANILTPFDNKEYVDGVLVDTTRGAGRDFDADMSAGSGTVYSSQDDTYTSDAGALPRDVGLIDSLLMGVGLKDKTAAYHSATADTIARTQGADAAARYIDQMTAAGNLSDADATALKTSTAYTAQDAEDRGLLDVSGAGDNDSGSDQTGGDDQTDGDGEEEDTGPPSSMNFRFFGGYQPRTRADVLVASPGADQPFVMPDDPRITPIFAPDANIDQQLGYAPTPGQGVATLYNAQPIDAAMNYGGGALAQAPAEDMVNRTPSFAAGVTPGPQMPGQGQFATMQELMEYQQKYPNVNLMGEYQRLKALEGGAAQPAVLPQRGVASLMGGDPATEAMFQGIMS